MKNINILNAAFIEFDEKELNLQTATSELLEFERGLPYLLINAILEVAQSDSVNTAQGELNTAIGKNINRIIDLANSRVYIKDEYLAIKYFADIKETGLNLKKSATPELLAAFAGMQIENCKLTPKAAKGTAQMTKDIADKLLGKHKYNTSLDADNLAETSGEAVISEENSALVREKQKAIKALEKLQKDIVLYEKNYGKIDGLSAKVKALNEDLSATIEKFSKPAAPAKVPARRAKAAAV